jgi:hypothetical protein
MISKYPVTAGSAIEATIARIIPRAPRRFPLTAERGCDMRFSPNMNKTEEIK